MVGIDELCFSLFRDVIFDINMSWFRFFLILLMVWNV